MQSADAHLQLEGAVAQPRERQSRKMNWRGVRRVPVIALGLALPSIGVLAGLFAAGRIDLMPALLAVVVIFVLLTLFVMPLALSLAAVQ